MESLAGTTLTGTEVFAFNHPENTEGGPLKGVRSSASYRDQYLTLVPPRGMSPFSERRVERSQRPGAIFVPVLFET